MPLAEVLPWRWIYLWQLLGCTQKCKYLCRDFVCVRGTSPHLPSDLSVLIQPGEQDRSPMFLSQTKSWTNLTGVWFVDSGLSWSVMTRSTNSTPVKCHHRLAWLSKLDRQFKRHDGKHEVQNLNDWTNFLCSRIYVRRFGVNAAVWLLEKAAAPLSICSSDTS